MTRRSVSAHGLVVALSILCASRSGAADGLAQQGEPSVSDLSMEVAALQTFHQLQLTRPQLEKLRKFAKETAQESSARKRPRGVLISAARSARCETPW